MVSESGSWLHRSWLSTETNGSPSPCLTFLIYQTGIILAPASQSCVKDAMSSCKSSLWNNVGKAISTLQLFVTVMYVLRTQFGLTGEQRGFELHGSACGQIVFDKYSTVLKMFLSLLYDFLNNIFFSSGFTVRLQHVI